MKASRSQSYCEASFAFRRCHYFDADWDWDGVSNHDELYVTQTNPRVSQVGDTTETSNTSEATETTGTSETTTTSETTETSGTTGGTDTSDPPDTSDTSEDPDTTDSPYSTFTTGTGADSSDGCDSSDSSESSEGSDSSDTSDSSGTTPPYKDTTTAVVVDDQTNIAEFFQRFDVTAGPNKEPAVVFHGGIHGGAENIQTTCIIGQQTFPCLLSFGNGTPPTAVGVAALRDASGYTNGYLFQVKWNLNVTITVDLGSTPPPAHPITVWIGAVGSSLSVTIQNTNKGTTSLSWVGGQERIDLDPAN